MISIRAQIIDRLNDLPDPELREVLSYVEFVRWRTTGQDEPLLTVAGILSGEGVSAAEVERQLYDGEEHT